MFRRYRLAVVVIVTVASMLFPASGSPAVSAVQAAAYADWASFVMDVTLPDGTIVAPSTPLTKTWRLKNIGTATWTTAYSLMYVNGDQMSAPSSVNLPHDVPPGGTVDVSVQIVSPPVQGTFRGNWMLRNATGGAFGIGSTASSVFWVEIKVQAPVITAFDFTENICTAAVWVYDGGPIPCPTKPEKMQYGYVQNVPNPVLENGTAAGLPAILTVPQNKRNGVIMGIYTIPQLSVGDHFQALVSCQHGAVNCYVSFELHYLTRNNSLVTIWKFREKYDGLFYRADIDLSRYAYMRDIRLVLVVSAAGPATGDLPLWVAPRIARPVSDQIILTPTPPFVPPTATPSVIVTTPPPTATNVPGVPTATNMPGVPTATNMPGVPTATLIPATSCDKAEFVQDVTIPDGTSVPPGGSFTKTWRLRNASTCIWTPSYSLVYVSGDQMGGPVSMPLANTVNPGQTVDISVNLKAPVDGGNYAGYWMLRNSSGGFFGIGTNGDKPFWVKISVLSANLPNNFDFVTSICSATWFSGAGNLPCPGTDGSGSGFAYRVDQPLLETGMTDSRAAILAGPQAVDYGYVLGIYPPMGVQAGDRFRSTIACQNGATSCDVFFRLDYQIDNGPINTLQAFHERYEGLSYNIDIDLSSLAGQNVKFILTVLSNGSPAGDRALWVGPHIYRPGGFGGGTVNEATATPLPPPPATETPLPTPVIIPTDTPMPPPTETPTPEPTMTETPIPTNTLAP